MSEAGVSAAFSTIAVGCQVANEQVAGSVIVIVQPAKDFLAESVIGRPRIPGAVTAAIDGAPGPDT